MVSDNGERPVSKGVLYHMKDYTVRNIFYGIPELDFDTGSRYFLGNIENYTKALLSILKSIKAKLPILRSMYQTGEYEGLRLITQTLRLMLYNVGATGLSEMSYRIETALLNDVNGEWRELLAEYILCLEDFDNHLETLLIKLDRKDISLEEGESYFNYDFTKTKESIKLSANLLERKII